MPRDEAYTVSEVTALLRVSRWTVYRLINSGELRSVLIGKRCRRIPATAVDAFLASRPDEVNA